MQVKDIHSTSETPWEFSVRQRIEDYIIEYRELIEYSQGSPLIGSLYINDEKIGKEEFLLKKNYLYIPKYVRKLWMSGFILCKIDLRTGQMENIGTIKSLIYLGCKDER